MLRPEAIASGAPPWVYALLVVLILLGIRRLRTREVPVAVALLPSMAFLVWTLIGSGQFAAAAGGLVAAITVAGGCALGWLSAIVAPEPRATRLPGGRLRQPASWMPMAIYLLVFGVRFATGAWAAIKPEQALYATGVGIAIGAAATTRLVIAVLRWQPVAMRNEPDLAST
jgi:hypothetical protein